MLLFAVVFVVAVVSLFVDYDVVVLAVVVDVDVVFDVLLFYFSFVQILFYC